MPCSLEFRVTNSTKPLASSMAVVQAGNRVILDQGGGHIGNRLAKERSELLEVGCAFALEVELGHGARSAGFARQR